MRNYKAVLPAVLVILFTVVLSLYYVARQLTSGNLQSNIRATNVLPQEIITVNGDAEIAVRGTPLSFKIIKIDSNPIVYQFYKGTEEIDQSKHVYTLQTQASDNATYAVVKVKTVFDDCEDDLGLDFCSKSALNRFKTVSACESVIGVVSVSFCQDLVLLGGSSASNDATVCNSITNQRIKELCLRHY